MKNKPYPALLRPSNQSNEIKKRVPKSRETIPLNYSKYYLAIIQSTVYYKCAVLTIGSNLCQMLEGQQQ
jgi:hypothetical protein